MSIIAHIELEFPDRQLPEKLDTIISAYITTAAYIAREEADAAHILANVNRLYTSSSKMLNIALDDAHPAHKLCELLGVCATLPQAAQVVLEKPAQPAQPAPDGDDDEPSKQKRQRVTKQEKKEKQAPKPLPESIVTKATTMNIVSLLPHLKNVYNGALLENRGLAVSAKFIDHVLDCAESLHSTYDIARLLDVLNKHTAAIRGLCEIMDLGSPPPPIEGAVEIPVSNIDGEKLMHDKNVAERMIAMATAVKKTKDGNRSPSGERLTRDDWRTRFAFNLLLTTCSEGQRPKSVQQFVDTDTWSRSNGSAASDMLQTYPILYGVLTSKYVTTTLPTLTGMRAIVSKSRCAITGSFLQWHFRRIVAERNLTKFIVSNKEDMMRDAALWCESFLVAGRRQDAAGAAAAGALV